MAQPRAVDVVIVSDIHLGTYGCRAKELLHYLQSIKPNTLVLNGDIIDIWQFSKHYWPTSHMRIIKQIFAMAAKGVTVYYVTGNHDEMLRKFAGFTMGSLQVVNKVVLRLDGKKVWIFHGDVFDITMKHSKWLAKLGAVGYDTLILLNAVVNFIYQKVGLERVSFSQKVKNRVKSAVKFINDFEHTAADIAISNRYDYVACGHIHHPDIRKISNEQGSTTYLNSGDWIENLSALEYHRGRWSLYRYQEDTSLHQVAEQEENLTTTQLYDDLMRELTIKPL